MQVLTAPAFGHSDCGRVVVGATLAQPVLAISSLVDVGSLDGTYVNRELVESTKPANGDEIGTGRFRLVVLKSRND